MNYKYITATGTETVEISEEWADILCQFDREEHALEEKERYHRAFSMDDYEHEGSKLASH